MALTGDRRAAVRALLAIAVRGTGALSALLVTVVVARTLGASEAGLFFLCYTLLQVLATPARLGLDGAVLRHAGAAIAHGNWAAARRLLATAITWTLFAGVAVVLLLLPLADLLATQVFDKPAVATPLRITLLAVPLLALLPVLASALNAASRPLMALAVQSILAPAATALLVLPWLLAGQALAAPGATAALVAGHAIALLLALATWRAMPRAGDIAATPGHAALVASARPLLAVSVMSLLVGWSAQLIAAALVPANELAWLGVAQRTAVMLALPHLAITATLSARAARLHALGDPGALAAVVGPATRFATALATVPALLMLFVPDAVMALFGEDFRAGGALLAILVIGQLVNVLTGPAAMLLTVSGHERDIRNLTFLSGFIALLLALVLTVQWGVGGAAVAATTALAVQNIGLCVYVRRRLGFWTLTGGLLSARSRQAGDA